MKKLNKTEIEFLTTFICEFGGKCTDGVWSDSKTRAYWVNNGYELNGKVWGRLFNSTNERDVYILPETLAQYKKQVSDETT